MEINGNPLKSIELHGNPWPGPGPGPRKSMEINRNSWKSIEINGNQWKSIEINQNSWKSMAQARAWPRETYGNQ
jgi:hypothetical protein